MQFILNCLLLIIILINIDKQLRELCSEKKIQFDEKKIHEIFLQLKQKYENSMTEEYIRDGFHFNDSKTLNDINKQVLVDSYYVNFGASHVDINNEELNDQKSIIITNKTKGKIMMSWNCSENNPFTITPQSCEIPPMKNYSFRIKFQPVS